MVSARHIAITAAVLAGAIILFGSTSVIDVWIQDHFYNAASQHWIIEQGERPWLDMIFYDGIKRFLIIMYSIFLLALIFGYRHEWIRHRRKQIAILVLSGMLVPLSVGGLKSITNVPCPHDWQQYGGKYPPVGIFDSYPENFCQQGKIRCWPAGHASFGFSLMAFYFVFRKRKEKLTALLVALGIGWSMGIYKILKGDHFLSHTVIAMIIGWLIILLIVRGIDIVLSRQKMT